MIKSIVGFAVLAILLSGCAGNGSLAPEAKARRSTISDNVFTGFRNQENFSRPSKLIRFASPLPDADSKDVVPLLPSERANF